MSEFLPFLNEMQRSLLQAKRFDSPEAITPFSAVQLADLTSLPPGDAGRLLHAALAAAPTTLQNARQAPTRECAKALAAIGVEFVVLDHKDRVDVENSSALEEHLAAGAPVPPTWKGLRILRTAELCNPPVLCNPRTSKPLQAGRIDNINDITSPPVVGRRYLVPCIPLSHTGLWWPIMGPRHADPDLGVPDVHHHYDSRFLTDRQVALILDLFKTARERDTGSTLSGYLRSVQGSETAVYVQRTASLSLGATSREQQRAQQRDVDVELRSRVCLREPVVFPPLWFVTSILEPPTSKLPEVLRRPAVGEDSGGEIARDEVHGEPVALVEPAGFVEVVYDGESFKPLRVRQVHCRGRWRAVKRKMQALAAELGWPECLKVAHPDQIEGHVLLAGAKLRCWHRLSKHRFKPTSKRAAIVARKLTRAYPDRIPF